MFVFVSITFNTDKILLVCNKSHVECKQKYTFNYKKLSFLVNKKIKKCKNVLHLFLYCK